MDGKVNTVSSPCRLLRIAVLWVFLGLGLTACQSSADDKYQVTFDQDVVLSFDKEAQRTIKSGEAVELPISPALVSRSHHRPVLLVPVPAEAGVMSLRLPKEDAAQASAGNPGAASEKLSNEILQTFVAVQTLILEKRADEALTRLQVAREKYPSLSYMRFLEVSCFVLKKDTDKARELLEQALKEFPDDPAGLALMAELKGMSQDDKPTPTP